MCRIAVSPGRFPKTSKYFICSLHTFDDPPVAHPEVHNGPAEVQAIDDHSGSAMFAHLGNFNGR